MLWFFVWFTLVITVPMFARIRRNRSAFGWFLFAVFLSPLLAWIILAILKPREESCEVFITE